MGYAACWQCELVIVKVRYLQVGKLSWQNAWCTSMVHVHILLVSSPTGVACGWPNAIWTMVYTCITIRFGPNCFGARKMLLSIYITCDPEEGHAGRNINEGVFIVYTTIVQQDPFYNVDSEKHLAGAKVVWSKSNSWPTVLETNDRDCIRPTVCCWSLLVKISANHQFLETRTSFRFRCQWPMPLPPFRVKEILTH